VVVRGYKALGGSARKYRTPSGKIISRREYDNKRAKKAGFKNRYELEKFRTQVVAKGRWADWQYDVKQHTGHMPTMEMYADVREIRQRRAKLRRRYPHLVGHDLDAKDSELVASDGPLARVLAASGRRPMSGRGFGDSD
jgi:hypothetical protein